MGVRLVPTAAGRVRLRDNRGPGPTVVPACDPPNVIEHYDTLFELLGTTHRVICLELPGFGFSRPAPGFGLPEYAGTVAEVLDDFARPAQIALADGALFCLASFTQAWFGSSAPDLTPVTQSAVAVSSTVL